MIETVEEKIKTHYMLQNIFRKSCRVWYNVEKCGTAGQTIEVNVVRRMQCAYWIT